MRNSGGRGRGPHGEELANRGMEVDRALILYYDWGSGKPYPRPTGRMLPFKLSTETYKPPRRGRVEEGGEGLTASS